MSMNLLNEIIDKYERGSDWRDMASVGTRSLSFAKTALYDRYGRSSLVAEARKLERLGLIRVKWLAYQSDLERVFYSLEQLPAMYEMADRVPKLERLETAKRYVEGQMAAAAVTPEAGGGARTEAAAPEPEAGWVRRYYRFVLEQLEKGNWPEELDHCGLGPAYTCGHLRAGDKDYVNLLFRCLNAISGLHNPIYKRIFSSHCFKDSKLFERKLQGRVVTIARRYFDEIDDNMNDSEVLSQLYIEEYSQELCVKGDLTVLQDGREMDLSAFTYGAVLNSEMLKHVTVPPGQKLKRIITVENKANYMSMPYEPGTLILFSHGYFSPKERDLLRELEARLRDESETRGRDEPVEYFHTGDLDYGGVCIFRYIRTKIFPRLKPYQMDVEQYERYADRAVPMEESSWEKLEKLEEPALQPLIERILKEKRVIEQESFLMPAERAGQA